MAKKKPHFNNFTATTFKVFLFFDSSALFFFLATLLNNACFALENTLNLSDFIPEMNEIMALKNITLSEWEIYFANKDRKQLGANPIFKRGFELFDTEIVPRDQAIALDIGCGVGFEAAWILQKGWNRVDCIDALPIVRDYLMKNVPEDAEKQGRLTFTPV